MSHIYLTGVILVFLLFYSIVSQVTRESNAIKEQKDKQIAELKSLAEQTGENALNNYEKKVLYNDNNSIVILYCSNL